MKIWIDEKPPQTSDYLWCATEREALMRFNLIKATEDSDMAYLGKVYDPVEMVDINADFMTPEIRSKIKFLPVTVH